VIRSSRARRAESSSRAAPGPRGRARWLLVGLLLAVMSAAPGAVLAEEEDEGDAVGNSSEEAANEGGWSRRERKEYLGGFTPYFNTGPYTTIQRVKGNVATTFGPSDTPRNTLTNLGWLFELGVASPAFERVPGKPRLHAFGGILIPTNESSVIGSQATEITTAAVRIAEDTKMALEYQTSYRAGLGLEFEFEVLDTRLTLKPAVHYLYLGSRYSGRAVSRSFFTSGTTIELESSAKNALVQHFVGPALKITTEAVDVGPVRLDLFIEGSLLFDVAGTRQQSRFEGAGQATTFTWEADTAAGVFNAGLRFRIP
jgi:hypothetical protein